MILRNLNTVLSTKIYLCIFLSHVKCCDTVSGWGMPWLLLR